jgi:hypothetical protein
MQKLAGLPARSYMILSVDQREEVETQLLQHGAQSPEVTVSGDTVLIHLPLSLKSSDN